MSEDIKDKSEVVRAFAVEIDEVVEMCSEIPPAGRDFSAGVRTRLGKMRAWAVEHDHVTEKMEEALANMREGVEKWLP